jgi:hypothetical protein
LDGYAKTDKGIFIEGRLFKAHERAKAVYEIMQSMGENDKGRVGLSVEGSIIERDTKNPKIIKKCQIRNVAVTFNPVNTDTYADLVKSFNSSEIEFEATEENATEDENAQGEPIFTLTQVTALFKALGIGAGYTQAADCLSGGSALSMESMDKKPKIMGQGPQKDEDDEKDKDKDEEKEPQAPKVKEPKAKKLPMLNKALFKATMSEILDKLTILYPDVDKSDLWQSVKERMTTIYPEVEEFKKSRSHKYIRREGSAGNYKYFYRDASGKEYSTDEPVIPVKDIKEQVAWERKESTPEAKERHKQLESEFKEKYAEFAQKPISKEAQAIIKPEWDKMQDFIKETDKKIAEDKEPKKIGYRVGEKVVFGQIQGTINSVKFDKDNNIYYVIKTSDGKLVDLDPTSEGKHRNVDTGKTGKIEQE